MFDRQANADAKAGEPDASGCYMGVLKSVDIHVYIILSCTLGSAYHSNVMSGVQRAGVRANPHGEARLCSLQPISCHFAAGVRASQYRG